MVKKIHSRYSSEQEQLLKLQDYLSVFDKEDFAALVYEQLKPTIGEFPAMIPVIMEAMEKSFKPAKQGRSREASHFIKAAMQAYFASRSGDEQQTNPESLDQLIAFAKSDEYAIPGYPSVRVEGKGNDRVIHYKDDLIGSWNGVSKAFDRANKLKHEWKTWN